MTTNRPMASVGKLFDLPNNPSPGDAKGNLYWADGLSLDPGLYVWNGAENVLLITKEELWDRMERK